MGDYYRRFDTVADFKATWLSEAKMTRSYFEHLTDESLKQPIADGFMNLGDLAWHLVTSIPGLVRENGLDIPLPTNHKETPEKVSEIITTFDQLSNKLLEEIDAKWNDETLVTVDKMWGAFDWPKWLALAMLVAHQGHHRGQMTVLMRQAGLKVPGVYGPSKEEMEQYASPSES